MKIFETLKTFLFMDEESIDYCGTHQVKKVKSVSKLHDKTIAKGYICPKCEMKLIDAEHIILRIGNKWVPVEEYAKQEGITI